MSHTDSPPAPPPAHRAGSRIAAARIITGFLQGLAAYGLWYALEGNAPAAWVLQNPKGFVLLCLLVLLLPLPVLLGLGHMRGRVLAAWTVLAGLLIILTGSHDLRQNATGALREPSLPLLLCLPPMLFIAHNLVSAADASRRWWPRYGACFEAAWRAAIQLALGGLFVSAFWGVYHLGGALFSLIGLEGLQRVGGKAWFYLPVTGMVAAAALHLADAQDRLTRGMRVLGLTLLGWLTPLLAVLTACFLLALLFSGPALLWDTGYAAPLLTVATATLIILINAVHQDGEAQSARPLRWAAHLAAVVLPVLVMLAAWGLWLRIDQYGLTRDRVVGVAALVVLAGYAVPYIIAALRPGMRLVEPANIAVAGVVVLVLLALNTPLADPSRLAVNSQVSRLLAGEVPAEKFDFYFLRYGSGRYGRQALARLQRHDDPAIATAARREGGTPGVAGAEAQQPLRLAAYPADAALPPAIRTFMEGQVAYCRGVDCVAMPLDLAGDGTVSWLVGPAGSAFWLFRQSPEGEWRRAENFSIGNCGRQMLEAVLAGQLTLELPREREIVVAGQRLRSRNLAPYCDEEGRRGGG
ncbi:hypothetical protein HMPREF9946_00211 [Acetobacteraceae bacterium AT-5844]|nr:hypothetical protein HMPREF9946_00211 [Acetobacteraceae bacterium AT-5844]